MTCPHCDGRPLPYLMQGRWELDPDGTNPALYITDPKGGDPLIVASIKRIHRPDILEGLGLPHKLPPPPDFEEVRSAEINRLREALREIINHCANTGRGKAESFKECWIGSIDHAAKAEAERDQALARLAAVQKETLERCETALSTPALWDHISKSPARVIRALPIDPDAQAALDKLLAEARLEGWRAGREAAALCLEQGADDYSCGCAPTYCRCHYNIEQMRIDADVVRGLSDPKEASHD